MEQLQDTKFYGAGYDKEIDHARLKGNLKKIFEFLNKSMWSGEQNYWYSLSDISSATNVPEASASACLRTLRNEHGYIIERRRSMPRKGLWLYRLNGIGTKPQKKLKPIGNKELFGEMMRAIYAYAAAANLETTASLANASYIWAQDFAHKIYTQQH